MNIIGHWHHAPGWLALEGNTGYGNAVDYVAQALAGRTPHLGGSVTCAG